MMRVYDKYRLHLIITFLEQSHHKYPAEVRPKYVAGMISRCVNYRISHILFGIEKAELVTIIKGFYKQWLEIQKRRLFRIRLE